MPSPLGFLRNFPAADAPHTGYLVVSSLEMMPVILGALEQRAQLFTYTEDSAYNGIQAIREVQVSIINGIGRLDDIYRLLDTAINGTEYADLGGGVISPDIPVVPRTDFDDTVQSVRWQLNEILTALGTGELSIDEVEALLNTIILALG